MTIDIMRSVNPALSLSSQVEDGETAVSYRRLYGKPTPVDLSSPRTAAMQDNNVQGDPSSRSKSAPPMPEENTLKKKPYIPTASPPIRKARGSFSFDKWEEEGLYQAYLQQRREAEGSSLPSLAIYYTSSDGSSTPSTHEGEDDEMPEEGRFGTDCLTVTEITRKEPACAAVNARAKDSDSRTSNNDSNEKKVQTPSKHHATRTTTTPSLLSSSLRGLPSKEQSKSEAPSKSNRRRSKSGLQHKQQQPLQHSPHQQQQQEAVLVLRPNPVKTIPPISSQQNVMSAGGVVAPTPRLASASFVAPPPMQQPQPSQPQPQPSQPQPTVILIPQPPQVQHQPTQPVRPVAAVSEPVVAAAVQPQPTKEPWCNQATSKKAAEEEEKKARKEQEEKEKQLRQAELKRRQELQCDFPNSYSNMPPTSGRASVVEEEEEDTRGEEQAGENGNNNHRQRNTETPLPPAQGRSASSNHRHNLGREENGSQNNNNNNTAGGSNLHAAVSGATPVFERLVTDEVRELQLYARMVENQNQEMDKMRRHQKDLEKRLQEESRLHEQLEATLEARERDWLARFEELEREIKRLNGVVKGEENKNKLLLDQIRKKDSDIQGMLKKKYDNEGTGNRNVRGLRVPPAGEQRGDRLAHAKPPPETRVGYGEQQQQHKSPNDYLRQLGSEEKVRDRNTRHLLMDFFGM